MVKKYAVNPLFASTGSPIPEPQIKLKNERRALLKRKILLLRIFLGILFVLMLVGGLFGVVTLLKTPAKNIDIPHSYDGASNPAATELFNTVADESSATLGTPTNPTTSSSQTSSATSQSLVSNATRFSFWTLGTVLVGVLVVSGGLIAKAVYNDQLKFAVESPKIQIMNFTEPDVEQQVALDLASDDMVEIEMGSAMRWLKIVLVYLGVYFVLFSLISWLTYRQASSTYPASEFRVHERVPPAQRYTRFKMRQTHDPGTPSEYTTFYESRNPYGMTEAEHRERVKPFGYKESPAPGRFRSEPEALNNQTAYFEDQPDSDLKSADTVIPEEVTKHQLDPEVVESKPCDDIDASGSKAPEPTTTTNDCSDLTEEEFRQLMGDYSHK